MSWSDKWILRPLMIAAMPIMLGVAAFDAYAPPAWHAAAHTFWTTEVIGEGK